MKKTSKIQIAQNYASALYETAVSSKDFESILNDCSILEATFLNMPELKYLKNPLWKPQQKKELIAAIAKKLKISEPMENFMQIVAENGRLEDLSVILNEFKHIFYHKQGIKEITVESAQELSEAQQKKLLSSIEKKLQQKVVADYIINPEILGGLIVRSGSLRIDDSLAGKLDRLEQVMKGKL